MVTWNIHIFSWSVGLSMVLMDISSVNNFDFNGQMEYPLLSFTVGMNGVWMDISLDLV